MVYRISSYSSRHTIGLRPDRSCIDSLVILTSDIHKGLINNSPTISAFLDMQGAFDNVIPNILIQDLKNIGISARVRMFILNLICERQLHFAIDGNMISHFLSRAPLKDLLLVLFYLIFTVT